MRQSLINHLPNTVRAMRKVRREVRKRLEVAILMGKSAQDEMPQVVLDAINVFDDAMNDTRTEIVYMDDYRYMRAANDE
jgi:hypothetical protein